MVELKNVAIIMDGNGRWAQYKGLNRTKGHEQGAEVVREITTYCARHAQIKNLILYAFSTENWKRPKYEVDFLLKMLDRHLRQEEPLYLKNRIRFDTVGDLSRFPQKLQQTIRELKDKTAAFQDFTQILALNYGAQDEITRAAVQLRDRRITPEAIAKHLDFSEPVDLLIRTGGEKRISNFLLWQLSYAELFFIDDFWPDFTVAQFESIIEAFYERERRFGGLV